MKAVYLMKKKDVENELYVVKMPISVKETGQLSD